MTLPRYEDRYVKVNGKNIRYWVQGEGPALVLVHGLACSANYWRYNIAELAQEYRVFAPDLLGFGLSDKDIDEFSLPYAGSVLAEFMDAVGIERASLGGNSMGGVICAQVAVQFRSRVDKLILVNSAGFGREINPVVRLWALPVVGSVVFSLHQRLFPLAVRLNFSHPRAVDQEWIDEATSMLRMPGVKESSLEVAKIGLSLRGQRRELLRDLHHQLRDMPAPTLIVWGSRDLMVPVSHAYAAQRLIPNAQVHIMDRCGHIPQVERPHEFDRLVLEFLGEPR